MFNRSHSTNDTPSVSFADSSLREGAGEGCVPFIGVLAKPWGYGRFSSPLRNSECLTAPIHRGTLPQSRPLGVTAPSEREPGRGGCHSSGYSLKSGVTGDFHRPYETLNVSHFTIHRSTCPLWVVFSFPGCRSPGGFWTASSRSPGTCRPGFPWPPSGALPGSWWGRRSRWRCRRGGGGR